MKNTKSPVTCVVVLDGTVTKRIPEKRVIYTDKVGGRFVRSGSGRAYPLNSDNEYRWEMRSVSAEPTPLSTRLGEMG